MSFLINPKLDGSNRSVILATQAFLQGDRCAAVQGRQPRPWGDLGSPWHGSL